MSPGARGFVVGALMTAAVAAVLAVGLRRGDSRAPTASHPVKAVHDAASIRKRLETVPDVETAAAIGHPDLDRTLALEPFRRTGQLYALAEAASAAEAAGYLAQLVAGDPSLPGRNEAIGLVVSKLAADAPALLERSVAAMAARLSPNDASTLYAAWAQTDVAGAVAGLAALGGSELTQRAGESIVAVAVAERPAAFDELIGLMPAGFNRGAGGATALAVLARTRPETAVGIASGIAAYGERDLALKRIAGAWVQQSPYDALLYADSMAEPAIADEFRRYVLGSWLAKDPETTLGILRSRTDFAYRDQLVHWSFYTLARKDPARAFALAREFSAGSRASHTGTVLGEWARHDAGAALAAFGSIKDEDARRQAAWQLARALVRQSPQTAIDWARSLDGDARDNALNAVGRELARSQPDHALDRLTSLGTGSRDRALLHALASGLADVAPARVAAAVVRLDNPSMRDSLLSTVAHAWADRDPRAALAWTESLTDAQRNRVASIIVRRLAATDIDTALDYFDRHGGVLRAQVGFELAQVLARHDPGRAIDWLDRFRDSPQYPSMLANALQVWAERDGPASARHALGLEDDEQRRRAVAASASAWARRDPDAARRWLDRLRDGPDRTAAIGNVAHIVAASDPVAAFGWVRSMPPGAARDAAILSVTRHVADRPDDAASMLELIDDDDRRREATQQTVVSIARYSVQDARRLIDTLRITPAERNRLVDMVEAAGNR